MSLPVRLHTTAPPEQVLAAIRDDARRWRRGAVPEHLRKQGMSRVKAKVSGDRFTLSMPTNYELSEDVVLRGRVIPHDPGGAAVVGECAVNGSVAWLLIPAAALLVAGELGIAAGLVFLASGRAIGDMFTKRQIERGENDVARYLVRCLEATVATLDVAAPANAPDSRGMDKQTSRQLIARVDAVLWEVWDPIGVNHEPLARDEYSSYAPDVAALLRAGAADAEIERHLSAIVLDRMGMSWVNPERTRRTLAALRAIAVAALPPSDASLP